MQVPTLNPYYPIGAPSNLTVNYNIGLEIAPLTSGNDVTDRYAGGLQFDLPAGWEGQNLLFRGLPQYAKYQPCRQCGCSIRGPRLDDSCRTCKRNQPGDRFLDQARDDSIPEPVLRSPLVCLQLASNPELHHGSIQCRSKYLTNEKGANFDGRLFSLPAGDVKAAVGGTYTSESLIACRLITPIRPACWCATGGSPET